MLVFVWPCILYVRVCVHACPSVTKSMNAARLLTLGSRDLDIGLMSGRVLNPWRGARWPSVPMSIKFSLGVPGPAAPPAALWQLISWPFWLFFELQSKKQAVPQRCTWFLSERADAQAVPAYGTMVADKFKVYSAHQWPLRPDHRWRVQMKSQTVHIPGLKHTPLLHTCFLPSGND